MTRIGELFKESNTDSVAMVVLEGDQPLGEDAHHYYDNLIRQLNADTTHVQHIQDFWGDPLTGDRSAKRRRQGRVCSIESRGNLGEALANESVDAVRNIVQRTPAPMGQGLCHRSSGTCSGCEPQPARERSLRSRWQPSW